MYFMPGVFAHQQYIYVNCLASVRKDNSTSRFNTYLLPVTVYFHYNSPIDT
jgi:hypothetical protein